MAGTDGRRVLISGAGIAGLTLAILLKERGWEPLVVERDPAARTEGYMMDFFGTGWDIADRMGLIPTIAAIRYPIDAMDYVDRQGRAYVHVPIARVRAALDHNYTYLRRPDLEDILHRRAREAGVEVRFADEVAALEDAGGEVRVTFASGGTASFALVFGADGFHSRIRELVFGPEADFARYLGAFVAAFHIENHGYDVGRALKMHEETDRLAAFYPLSDRIMDATFIFRRSDGGHIPHDRRLAILREIFSGPGWIAARVLADYPDESPVYFDSLTQIVMPQWSRGRVALLGDACGCLTLLAGQGSHLAMAGAFVLATELARHVGDHTGAFAAYQKVLERPVAAKQKEAAGFARIFMPTARSRPWLRRLATKAIFSPLVARYAFAMMGAKSILRRYP